MEEIILNGQPADQLIPASHSEVPGNTETVRPSGLALQASGSNCPTCLPASETFARPGFVYAIGRIEARFPSLAVEKEFAQAGRNGDNRNLTDSQVFHKVLNEPQNRYLIRQLCWVMVIEGMDTYLLSPRDPADYAQLLDTLRPNPNPADMDMVIGIRGPIAPAEMCNGLMVPIVFFDQIYSFSRQDLLKSIPRPDTIREEDFQPASEQVLDRILQLTDNAGSTDEHRALNYLAVKYPGIYSATAEAFGKNASLSAVEVRASGMSGIRKMVDVIFSFSNRQTDVAEKFFVRVDVSEEFPFLVKKMSPYYDR